VKPRSRAGCRPRCRPSSVPARRAAGSSRRPRSDVETVAAVARVPLAVAFRVVAASVRRVVARPGLPADARGLIQRAVRPEDEDLRSAALGRGRLRRGGDDFDLAVLVEVPGSEPAHFGLVSPGRGGGGPARLRRQLLVPPLIRADPHAAADDDLRHAVGVEVGDDRRGVPAGLPGDVLPERRLRDRARARSRRAPGSASAATGVARRSAATGVARAAAVRIRARVAGAAGRAARRAAGRAAARETARVVAAAGECKSTSDSQSPSLRSNAMFRRSETSQPAVDSRGAPANSPARSAPRSRARL
jgi:hypothetical protein